MAENPIKFTERVKRIILAARVEAEMRHHEFLDTEHLLLGMLNEGGFAIRSLQTVGLGVQQIRTEIERYMQPSVHSQAFEEINFSPMAKQVLRHAVEEQRLMKHNTLGSEHLLLGLMRATEGAAYLALHVLGVDVNALRKKVLEMHEG